MTDEQYLQENLESELSPNVVKTLGCIMSARSNPTHSFLFSAVRLYQNAKRPSIRGMAEMQGVKDIQRLYHVGKEEAKQVFTKLGNPS